MDKSLDIVTVDELTKADPKEGTYHKQLLLHGFCQRHRHSDNPLFPTDAQYRLYRT